MESGNYLLTMKSTTTFELSVDYVQKGCSIKYFHVYNCYMFYTKCVKLGNKLTFKSAVSEVEQNDNSAR